MRSIKTIRHTRLAEVCLSRLAATYIRFVYRTGRWTISGDEAPRRCWAARKPFVVCFWHGRMLLLPCVWNRDVPVRILISRHLDGRLIARSIRHFGVATIAGSSSKGGFSAMRAILRAIADGDCIGITPDGPRGPRMRASAGAVHIARLAGVPIFPATFSTARRRVFGSWDRFLFPLPFSRGVYLWGEPITLARNADSAAVEAARQQLEDRLNDLTREADRICGHPAIEPATEPVSETRPPGNDRTPDLELEAAGGSQ